MLFTPLLLVCTLDFSACKAHTSGGIYSTEQECMVDLAEGVASFAGSNVVVVEAQCTRWVKTESA